jgi:hypothetical protein
MANAPTARANKTQVVFRIVLPVSLIACSQADRATSSIVSNGGEAAIVAEVAASRIRRPLLFIARS